MRKKFEKFADAFDELTKRTDKVVNDTLKSCEDLKVAKERIKGLSAAKNNLILQNDKLTGDVNFWRNGSHEAYLEKKELEGVIAARDESIKVLDSNVLNISAELEIANNKIAAEQLIAENAKKALAESQRHLHESQEELRTLILTIGTESPTEESSGSFDLDDPPTEGLDLFLYTHRIV